MKQGVAFEFAGMPCNAIYDVPKIGSGQLGAIVRKCWSSETPEQSASPEGEFAVVVGIVNEPTFLLVGPDGHSYSWCQRLTRPAGAGETIAYWKARAETAERRLEGIE